MPNDFFVSFPGLGIAPFELHKIAFSLFGRDVAFYGILICIGLLLGYFYGSTRFKKENLRVDDYLNILLLIIPFGIVGARLFYVLTSLGDYIGRPFLDWIAVWEGGIAIYGAVIAGILCILVYTKLKRISTLKVLDALAPALLIGQILGRWGNFFNGEAHGGVTELPWRMGLGATAETMTFVHPTFLYESLWNLALFLVIHFLLYKKKKYNGEIFLFYAAFYGAGRCLIELLRTDSLYVFGLRISHLIGAVSFVVCGILFILGFVRAQSREKASTPDPLPETATKTEDAHDNLGR